jgi:hypothetical protein
MDRTRTLPGIDLGQATLNMTFWVTARYNLDPSDRSARPPHLLALTANTVRQQQS